MKDKDKKIVSSAELQKELNEERKAKVLKEMPAVNPTKAVVQIHTAAWIIHGKMHLTFLSR